MWTILRQQLSCINRYMCGAHSHQLAAAPCGYQVADMAPSELHHQVQGIIFILMGLAKSLLHDPMHHVPLSKLLIMVCSAESSLYEACMTFS